MTRKSKMFAKAAVFAVFAQALLIQSALSQVCSRSAFAAAPGLSTTYGLAGRALISPFGYNGLASGLSKSGQTCNGLADNSLVYDSINAPVVEITPTTGGALPVTSASAIAPNSLVVASENVYEGTLAVEGELPFVGTVAMEGVVPSAGAGAVNHACGNGATRMVSQDGAVIASGFGTGLAPAVGLRPGNLYGGIGATFGYGTGLTGLANAGLARSYPALALGAALPPVAACGGALGLGAYGGAIGSAYGGALTSGAGYGGPIASGAAYGGAGEGNVAVIGELPVAGNTAVAGQVPIMGAVRFGGDLPAAGSVSISGKCACGCGNPYVY